MHVYFSFFFLFATGRYNEELILLDIITKGLYMLDLCCINFQFEGDCG